MTERIYMAGSLRVKDYVLLVEYLLVATIFRNRLNCIACLVSPFISVLNPVNKHSQTCQQQSLTLLQSSQCCQHSASISS